MIKVDHTMHIRCDTAEELTWASAKLEVQKLSLTGNPQLVSHIADDEAKTIEVVFEEEIINQGS